MQAFKQLLQSLGVDLIQLLALILGVTEVLLARANKVWLYPAGISAILLSMYSLFQAQLYAECSLNLYYLVMSIYGWIYWTRRQMGEEVKVANASTSEWYVALSIVFGGWVLLYVLLTQFTPSDVPSWDAIVSSTGWAGMWLLAKRKVENWLFLNVSNALAIPLLIQKELHMLAILTAILFAVACIGYFDWRKIANQKTAIIS